MPKAKFRVTIVTYTLPGAERGEVKYLNGKFMYVGIGTPGKSIYTRSGDHEEGKFIGRKLENA